ncbi:MAG: hypothetical protein OH337_03830 [Candidatus Parvarchaeota archaeon]|nr:hypothetical protein [Candidatus Haiyanarchaeum thermophilum]
MPVPEDYRSFEKWVDELYNRLRRIYEEAGYGDFWEDRYSIYEFRRIFREVYNYGRSIGRWDEFYETLVDRIDWEKEFDVKSGDLIGFLTMRGLYPPRAPEEEELMYMELEQDRRLGEEKLAEVFEMLHKVTEELLENAKKYEQYGVKGEVERVKRLLGEYGEKWREKYGAITYMDELLEDKLNLEIENAKLREKIAEYEKELKVKFPRMLSDHEIRLLWNEFKRPELKYENFTAFERELKGRSFGSWEEARENAKKIIDEMLIKLEVKRKLEELFNRFSSAFTSTLKAKRVTPMVSDYGEIRKIYLRLLEENLPIEELASRFKYELENYAWKRYRVRISIEIPGITPPKPAPPRPPEVPPRPPEVPPRPPRPAKFKVGDKVVYSGDSKVYVVKEVRAEDGRWVYIIDDLKANEEELSEPPKPEKTLDRNSFIAFSYAQGLCMKEGLSREEADEIIKSISDDIMYIAKTEPDVDKLKERIEKILKPEISKRTPVVRIRVRDWGYYYYRKELPPHPLNVAPFPRRLTSEEIKVLYAVWEDRLINKGLLPLDYIEYWEAFRDAWFEDWWQVLDEFEEMFKYIEKGEPPKVYPKPPVFIGVEDEEKLRRLGILRQFWSAKFGNLEGFINGVRRETGLVVTREEILNVLKEEYKKYKEYQKLMDERKYEEAQKVWKEISTFFEVPVKLYGLRSLIDRLGIGLKELEDP